MMSETKIYAGNLNGLLPILVLGHDTIFCIVTGRVWEAAQGHATTWRPGARHGLQYGREHARGMGFGS